MKTSSRLASVSAGLSLTSFLISGSPGVGGITGTGLDFCSVPGSLLKLYLAVFGTRVTPSSFTYSDKFAPSLIFALKVNSTVLPALDFASSSVNFTVIF